jgi:hypothetical protein
VQSAIALCLGCPHAVCSSLHKIGLLNTPSLSTQCVAALVLTVRGTDTAHKCTLSCHRSSAVVDDAILQEDFITTALHVQQDKLHLCRVQMHCA